MKRRNRIISPVSLLLAVWLLVGICSPAAAVLTGTDSFKVYTPAFSQASEYGYIEPRWVDENGVEFSSAPLEAPLRMSLKSFSAASVLPAAYDSRSAGYITNVKYQSDANICWAFTAMGVLEAYDIRSGASALADTDYSESHLAWFTGRSLSDNSSDTASGDGYNRSAPYSYGGNRYYAVGTLARWSGIANEADFPFDPDYYSTNCTYVESERYVNNGRLLRSMEQFTTVADAKQAIIDNGAIEAAIYYEDNIEAFAANGDYVYYSPNTGYTNHAIIIVGWNDDYPVTAFPQALRPSSPGAWLIRNSWSEYWGDAGYMWVSYETGSLGEFTAYTSMSADGYDNNYQYDGFGISHSIFYSANNVKTANVFTARGNEILKSVCFYTVSQNTACSIRIYKNLIDSYTSPTQGVLAYESSPMIFPNTGYYTVDLSEEISLDEGEIFSVAVFFDGSAGFPVEPTPSDTSVPAFSAHARESYYAIGSSSWADFVESGSGGNLHIKALTENIAAAPALVPNTTIDEFMELFSNGIREFFALLFARIFAR